MADDKTNRGPADRSLHHISIGVGLVASICGLISNLFASKVFRIFWASTPIVIAVVASVLFLALVEIQGHGTVWVLTGIWFVVAKLSYAVWVPNADQGKNWHDFQYIRQQSLGVVISIDLMGACALRRGCGTTRPGGRRICGLDHLSPRVERASELVSS